ncbi:uncharacterized protein LOC130166936 isoform X3 [Seriola aureovittata]|uniref:uncharacterized protein LOC130166936 isoform X3 n=1 Tax=Seriola aureovittata TaxID=2871759 RepID=UPI0024BE8B59|nr:uncharacterized protein LOC130166936 isoform X3 [Seriola aureovittata]
MTQQEAGSGGSEVLTVNQQFLLHTVQLRDRHEVESTMDGETGLVSGCNLREKKRSDRYFWMDVGGLEEPALDVEECGTKEPKCSLSKMRQQLGNRGTEPELNAAESSGFLSAYPVCMSHDRWGERGGGGEEASPSSLLEYSVYLDDQHNIADCTITRPFSPPVTSVTHRLCPLKSAEVNPAVSSPMTDTCSPFDSMCSPTGSAWDTLRSTSDCPGCSDRDPVSAAAHLHLLGESLSLIGHHLQETDKMVSMSSSLSLLLDSLLCALAPLICLTAQIPELRSCTEHTLASTLENISYVMPGL